MKNILIPTTLENDTLTAVTTAIKHAKGSNATIVLMDLCDAPDAYTAAEFLRKNRQPMTAAQNQVLEQCSLLAEKSGNCTLRLHRQQGLTGPLLRNLLDYLATDLIILSPSYKAETCRAHRSCISLLAKCKTPILHLGHQEKECELTNALYLENNRTRTGLQELQQLVSGQFSFRIVSQAQLEEQNPRDMTPFLSDAIARNNIDLLIETRRPQGRTKQHIVNDQLGLPVLSIHEEAIKA